MPVSPVPGYTPPSTQFGALPQSGVRAGYGRISRREAPVYASDSFKASVGLLAMGTYFHKYLRALLPESAPFALKPVLPPKPSSQTNMATLFWSALGLSAFVAVSIVAHKASRQPKTHNQPPPPTNPAEEGAPVIQPTPPQIMRFIQNKAASTAVTAANPISDNNCVVCSVKNLMAYLGSDQVNTNHMMTLLGETIKPGEVIPPGTPSPHFPMPGSTNVELNPQFFRHYIETNLGMRFTPYTRHALADINDAIDRRRPIWVFADQADGHTLAVSANAEDGGKHYLSQGHAYMVVPITGTTDKWAILDSWAGETELTTANLKRNLNTMTSNASVYNVVENNPFSP